MKNVQIIYGLGISLGAFLIGCCIGATQPHDYVGIKQSMFEDTSWGADVWWVRCCFPLSALLYCLLAALNIGIQAPKKALRVGGILFLLVVVLYMTYFWDNENRKSFRVLGLYRILQGLACGILSTTLPIFLGEIAQNSIRGAMISFFYLNLIAGELTIYYFLSFQDFAWQCLVGVGVGLLFTFIAQMTINSPLYLMQVNEDKAKETLVLLRGKGYNPTPDFESMKAIMTKYHETSNVPFLKKMVEKVNLRTLLICGGLMFWQQFSGVHSIFRILASNFSAILSDDDTFDRRYSIIIMRAIQAFGALLATFLVDWAGRRTLLLISAISMTILMLSLAIVLTNKVTGWLPLIMQLLFVMMYSFGFGPVPWIIAAELFSLSVKKNAVPLVVGSFWLFHYINADLFIQIEEGIAHKHFVHLLWLYSCVLVLAFAFVVSLVPETKRKSAEAIEELFE